MELSKSTQEILTRAQMMRLEQNADDLVPEHILSVLLEAGSDSSIPANEAQALNTVLNNKLAFSLSAKSELTAKLRAGRISIESGAGMAVVGRAGEMAEAKNGGVITPQLLAEAVFDHPTEAIRALMKAEKKSEPPKPVPPKPEPVKPVPPKPDPVKPNDDSDPTGSQLLEMLKALAVMNALAQAMNNQSDVLKTNSKPNRIKKKKKTKLGLITYRGGTFWAAVQYFALGVFVPLLVLFALENFTGCVLAPQTPFVGFLVDAFIMVSFYSLLNGVALLLGQLGNAFGNFLQMLCQMALAYGLAWSVTDAWGMPDFPVWLRVVLCTVIYTLLLVHNALYNMLADEGDKLKTKIMFREAEGSAGKIFFESLGKKLDIPFLIFAVVWIRRAILPPWMNKALWIAGFFLVFSIVSTMWVCLSLKKDYSHNKTGRLFVKFCGGFHIFMVVPYLLMFLHWLFAWSPVKVFVWVIVGLWTLCSLILSLVLTTNERSNMII